MDKGLQMAISTACCSGTIYCATGILPASSATISGKLDPCKIYYLTIDGYNGSYCDYNLVVTGGAANIPLVLKNINNVSNNVIHLNRGACDYKFAVEPKDAPCEGYMEWTLDGNPIDDHDREIKLDFPDEGDFQLCVTGYIGLPNFNCGQSNMTCTKIEVRQEHLTANPRVLCNELKGYKWFKQSINSSGIYNQVFQEKCHIFDSTVEFIFLPKPQSGVVNYFSCSKSDPYLDPVWKDYYKKCTNHRKIIVPKSTEIYACDSSYLLSVAFIDIQNRMHLSCKNSELYMIPEITNYTDTCGIGIHMELKYAWYEKVNDKPVFISSGNELRVQKKANYQLQVIANYAYGQETGSCTFVFDEDIDEDAYLLKPNTGSLKGKLQVCKGDIECYSIYDLVRNPFSFSWSVDQGTIVTPDPNKSDKVCVNWDKNSLMSKGKICVNYEDSCSGNLQACLEVEFGKSEKDIAGPNQEIKGVLGTKMNAQGKSGLWTYAGGPGFVYFTNPSDPNTKLRVSRFGNYTFKWTVQDADCEAYGFMTINFYLKYPEAEGENLLNSFTSNFIQNINGTKLVSYSNGQIRIHGETFSELKTRIQIVNLQGQSIYTEEVKSPDNILDASIKLKLRPGIYFLLLENNVEYQIIRFPVLE
jgi:hypothetical protein